MIIYTIKICISTRTHSLSRNFHNGVYTERVSSGSCTFPSLFGLFLPLLPSHCNIEAMTTLAPSYLAIATALITCLTTDGLITSVA